MAALDRALALDERQHRAVRVAEQLHFDVARARQAALEIDRGVAEGGARFRSRRAHRAGQIGRVGDRAHALAAAAGDRLDQQRVADRGGRLRDVGVGDVGRERILGAGHDRHAGARRRRPRRGLAAHRLDRFGRRPDEGQAGVAHRGGEVFVLGEEAVARVDAVGARFLRGVDDRVDAQVAFARRARADRVRLVRVAHVQRRPIAFGVDGDRRHAQLAAGADDAHRDLAAVGDQNLFQGPTLIGPPYRSVGR